MAQAALICIAYGTGSFPNRFVVQCKCFTGTMPKDEHSPGLPGLPPAPHVSLGL